MNKNIIFVLTFFIIFTLVFRETWSFKFNFNKIFCNATDPNFVIFKTCKVKAISRNLQHLSLYAKLLQKPVTNVITRFQFMKRLNGWKPFMYDIKVGCDFLRKLNPLTKLIWSWVQDVSNINGSCPYNYDIEVNIDNTYISSKALIDLPVPSGEYALMMTFDISNKTKAWLNFYGTIY